jgi:hypothetical protein
LSGCRVVCMGDGGVFIALLYVADLRHGVEVLWAVVGWGLKALLAGYLVDGNPRWRPPGGSWGPRGPAPPEGKG